MRKTREILRQKWLLGCSNGAVAQSVGVSVGAVGETLRRARQVGLTWAQVVALADDTALEARLYPRPPGTVRPRPQPDCVYLRVSAHHEREDRTIVNVEIGAS